MDINEAQAVIQAEADRLAAAMCAKGYARNAEIWIGRDMPGQCTIFIRDTPRGIRLGFGLSVAVLVEKALNDIAAMPHKDEEARAYADELSGPLYLLSEHPNDEAA